MQIIEYLAKDGKCPFARWFNRLNAEAAAKVSVAAARMEAGNFSNAKSVGKGVQEYKIDFGPGYRLYFGRDGAKIVILLGGGTKKRQSGDIEAAQLRWADYKRRKKKG